MSETSIISTSSSLTSSELLSPIRKRSLIPQIRSNKRKIEELNDDDAERSSLVASDRISATSTPKPSRSGRNTMLSSPQKEHFQRCLKLYAENKINKDNAWNLQLIDLMTSMLSRNDARMNNLQIASTVIGASARIYSLRVDAIHYDVLKMARGLSKAAQSKRGEKDDNYASPDEAPTEGDAEPPRKRKKRSKGAIAANPEILNGDFDAIDYIDPLFARLALQPGDVTSSNRAFNATLPIDDETFAFSLRTDDQFLQHNNENVSEELELEDYITIPVKLLPAFLETDHICEPFTGFTFNWDPETEDSDNRVTNWVEENMLNISQQTLTFDVNAEVEPIPQDEGQDHLFENEPLAGISSNEKADVGLATCLARLTPVRASVTDLRPGAPHHARLEYSYCSIVNAWAGPAHWRFKQNRALKMSGRSQTEGEKPRRTKRQLDFLGAGLAFDAKSNNVADYERAKPAKITISQKTLATGKRWNEANYKTPVNRGLDETHLRKSFLRPNVLMMREQDKQKQGTEPLTVEENKEYDCNMDNDAPYCSNHVPDDDECANEDATAAGDVHEQVRSAESEELGDLLEPPAKVAKIFIPYAMRAKNVNMKQLKHCIWNTLTEKTPQGEREFVTETTFFNMYSRLQNKLTPDMRESISISLALSSVLHLATEKGLELEKRDDLTDFGIKGVNKN